MPTLHPADLEIQSFQIQLRNPLVLCLILTACLLGNPSCVHPAFGYSTYGQDALVSPQLRISAPEAQPLVVAIRYFDSGNAQQTEIQRLVRPNAAAPLELDGFHDGIHIVVQSPTSRDISLELLEEDKVIATKVVNGPGQSSLHYGSAPPDDQITLPAFLPNESEKRMIVGFIQAINSGRTTDLVSDQEFANIDVPTLNAFVNSLSDTFGPADLEPQQLEIQQRETQQLDGWIAWNGSIGARILVGNVPLKRGICQFKLVLGAGKLIDVEPYSPQLTDDWYRLDEVPQTYIRDTHRLIEAILTGKTSAARAAFSARYRDEITPDAIRQLSQRLRTALGKAPVNSSVFSFHELSPYDWEARGCTLKLHSITTLENGKKCLGTVEFFIPSHATLIGRAHLRSVELYETWPSAYPEQAAIAKQLLNTLGMSFKPSETSPATGAPVGSGEKSSDHSNESSDEKFTQLSEAIHPDVIGFTPDDALKQFFDRSRTAIATATALSTKQSATIESPNMELWTFQSSPVQVTVNGRVAIENNSIDLEMFFFQQQLLGLTIRTPFYSASTLDLVDVSTAAQQLGTKFWTALLSGDTVAAHQFLAPEFQEQLPLDLFQEIYQKSALVGLPEIKAVQVDTVRLSDNLERAEPVMLTGYFVAEFTEDKGFQPLRCDFRLPAATNPTQLQKVPRKEVAEETTEEASRDAKTETKSTVGTSRDTSFALLNFSTDFEASFPSQSPTTADIANKFLNAFSNRTSEDIRSLLHPSKRETVEPEILDAFLVELQPVLDKTSDTPSRRLEHVYQIGTRQEHLRVRVPAHPVGDFTENWIAVEATFEFGYLATFQFHHPALEHFVDRLSTTAPLENRLAEFFSTWLRNDLEALERFTTPEMQTPVLKDRLRRLRNELRVELGTFESAELLSFEPDDGANEFTASCRLNFQKGAREAILRVECDALSSRIYSVSVASKPDK